MITYALKEPPTRASFNWRVIINDDRWSFNL